MKFPNRTDKHNKKRKLVRSFQKTSVPSKILKGITALAQTQLTKRARRYSSILTNKGIVSIDNQIKGWMNGKDLLWLFNTAKRMESIVEIGSWKGMITI